ncbi:hypothetical protein H5410_044916 [Solanum commersonii]|uniref:Uncharacterized protein n=1 Tax=Solanum commersonii TaxID=4109 RepID=A0A9J5X9I1_SOLCO|nr:hypothetical protein H5410_044916 [Solanum commersonii]
MSVGSEPFSPPNEIPNGAPVHLEFSRKCYVLSNNNGIVDQVGVSLLSLSPSALRNCRYPPCGIYVEDFLVAAKSSRSKPTMTSRTSTASVTVLQIGLFYSHKNVITCLRLQVSKANTKDESSNDSVKRKKLTNIVAVHVSCLCEIGITPALLVSPTVGLIPTTELALDGDGMEPAVSVPNATAAMFAAIDVADPVLDPDGSALAT